MTRQLEHNDETKRYKKITIVCGVLILSSANAFWRLSQTTLSNHECLVSITAREMLQSGEWILPTCNGQPRLQKTPLPYWFVAGLSKLTGSVDEFAARMPNAILAVLSATAILYFVNRWSSFKIAALSASIWVTSLGYIRYSHNAQPEMPLTFFIMLCLLSFYSAITERSRNRQVVFALVFWVSFGLANLAKGPAPLPLVLAPLFFYIAVFRRWKKVPKLLPVIGMVIFLAIVLPWPLAVGYKVDWNLGIWKAQFIDRFVGEYASGHKPFYYYLYIMFQFILPWSAFLPMALVAPFYNVWKDRQPIMRFLWFWFVIDLAVITICGGKRQHYILPLMPSMAMLIGILLNDMVFVRKAYTHGFAKAVLRYHILVIIIAAIGGSIFVAVIHPQFLISTIILTTLIVTLTSIVGLLFVKGRPGYACAAVFAGIAVCFMVFYTSFSVLIDHNRSSRDFSKRISEIVPPLDKLVAFNSVSKRSVHYFGKVIPVIEDVSTLYKHYEDSDWIIATCSHLEKLLQDRRFRKVFYKEKAELSGQKYMAGALFHKSAPVINNGSNSTSSSRPNLAEGE